MSLLLSPTRFWVATVALVAFGLWLRADVFRYEFSLDDYAQIAMLEGRYPAPRSPLDLYTFSNGSPADVRALVEAGFYPWFTHPELRLSMLRPLSSALTALDHGLFGRSALAYRIHSAAWWCALLVLLAAGLRAVFGSGIALLALLLFCVDEVHSVALGWMSNRNALISIVLSLLAFGAYRSHRERGRRGAAAAACLAFATALAAGEYALCMLAYALAYEVFVSTDASSVRLRGLALWAAPAALFLAARTLGGFGAYGSDMYLDPFRDPGFFLRHGLARLPVLFGDVVWGFPSEWWTFAVTDWTRAPIEHGLLPPAAAEPATARAIQGACGVVAAAVLGALALAAVRGSTGGRRRWLAACGAGSALAFLPLLAGFPSTRALIAPWLGFCVVLASLLGQALRRGQQPWHARAAQLAAAALCLAQLGFGARAAASEASDLALNADLARDIALTAEVDEARLPAQRVVLLNAGHPGVPIYFSLIRGQYGRTTPLSAWTLNPSFLPYWLTRTGERSLQLEFVHGKLLDGLFERVFRTHEAPVRRGQRFVLPSMTVTVLATQGGAARTLRVDFDRALEDPGLCFLVASPSGLSRAALPEIGERRWVRVPAYPARLARRER